MKNIQQCNTNIPFIFRFGDFSFKFLLNEEDFFIFRLSPGNIGDFSLFSSKITPKCHLKQRKNGTFGDPDG